MNMIKNENGDTASHDEQAEHDGNDEHETKTRVKNTNNM